MAKISVNLEDELAQERRQRASENVSRFVADVVREALNRKQLLRALDLLGDELGPVDERLRQESDALFAEVDAANPESRQSGPFGPCELGGTNTSAVRRRNADR